MPDLHVNGRKIINQNQSQFTESAAIEYLRTPQKSLHKQTNKKVHRSWLRPSTLPPPQMPLSCVVWLKVPGEGGYSIYPWVGRCSPAPHTLTLFKRKTADFPALLKTEFRFLIPCLRHLTRNLISYPDLTLFYTEKWVVGDLGTRLLETIPCVRQ